MKTLSVEPRQPEFPAEPMTDPARIDRHHIADLQPIRDTEDTHPLTIEHRDTTIGIGEPETIAPIARDGDRGSPATVRRCRRTASTPRPLAERPRRA